MALGLLLCGSMAAEAQTSCTGGNQKDCTLGSDGISFTSGVDRVTVDPNASPISIVPGRAGVSLTDIGGSPSDGAENELGAQRVLYSTGEDEDDPSDDRYILADLNGGAITDDDGALIFVAEDDSFHYDNGDPVPDEKLNNYIDFLANSDSGGPGVAAGGLTVVNRADFSTSNASGIVANSTGGKGGKGGTVNLLLFEIGKKGGNGKNGGSLAVTSGGVISVSGDNAYGVVATSQGGDGGQGGGWGALVSKAGKGGDGGNGGSVEVVLNSSSSITTSGLNGHGVLAQSLGGDGGRGGNSGGAVALGSKGGDGGDGGDVSVNNRGTIATSGDHAYGIFARSYGAGAGSGSSAGGIVAIGGNGGGYASGGAVDVSNTGVIQTTGIGSYGVHAQSIGGGGGDGGNSGGIFTVGGDAGSGGDGANVTVCHGSTHNAASGACTGSVESASILTTNDRATAILAQSIGGGGGNGGRAVSVSLQTPTVAIGGAGGPGGHGGDVAITANGRIETHGSDANAIEAQSIGGGGGSGGYAISVNAGTLPSFAVAVGGSGEEGGNAGAVTVTSNADIRTIGDRSRGIAAQSIGGGGGNGGASVAGTVTAAPTINVSVAGSGDGGGSGGAVAVNVEGGSITTGATNALGETLTGHGSHAILAQSVGGGGGSGGLAVSASLSAGNLQVGLGGSGAKGGAGGTTRVSNAATLDTAGDGAYGIFAQSVGGGGGDGGLSVAAGLSASVSVNVGLGGTGGSGAIGGLVEVDNTGAIVTRGGNSYGILAQSVGGGGGAGGNTIAAGGSGGIVAGSVAIGIGGSGGGGGRSGTVRLGNTADVTTLGAGSTALIAQSIGGGGGAGGYAVAATLTVSKDAGVAASVALGGSGGDGGTAGGVTANNSGNLNTFGDGASGIVAQSLGGAGGVGGTAVAGSLNFSKGSGVAVSVALGGSGGSGGIADLVTVTNDGAIATGGADAFGVLAQSIGGSGGVGGMSIAGALSGTAGAGGSVAVSLGGDGGDGGRSGAVTVTNNGQIVTTGARSGGVVAQSIGGEGGAGGLSVGLSLSASTQAQTGAVGVSLGGSGGGGGTAGAVTLTNTGRIATSGASNTNAAGERVNTDAHALIAQSIGGSGGIGGFGGAAAVALGKEQTVSASVAVGGGGGAGGEAGAVRVNNSGDLSTGSDNSIGIVAQSIGGGGGLGGGSAALSFAFSQASNSGSIGVSVGGGGGAGVRASTVDVDSTGNIVTLGASAYGILAQSIGGDGGQGGFTVAATGTYSRDISGAVGVAVGGQGGVGGTAGDVTVGSTAGISGIIATQGENAAGIVAQSIGGGGGAGGFAGSLTGVVNGGSNQQTVALGVTVGGFGGSGGQAGAVTVNMAEDAVIATQGDFAYGILAQSIGGKGGTGGGALGAVLNVATQGNKSVNAALTVGGFGGAGAKAGAVNVDNDGTIMTGDPLQAHAGQFAHGILAQSIGGDGGAGGFSGSIAIPVGASGQTAHNYSLSASVGGFGGAGADAGTVHVDNSGTIIVYGERASGIFAQSVGGGGGAGGDTGLGDDVWGEDFLLDTAVEKVFAGDFDSLDLGAGGAYTGGYGANSHSLAASVGGFGGAGGDGSTVTVDNSGQIWTFGTSGHAIFAQSVGGGGGQGGISTAASSAIAASNSASISLAVGGFGGAGGNGGNVIVDNEGQIVTVYHGAYGVFAQSVGGGGGAGGDTRGFTLQRKDETLTKEQLKPGKQLTVTVGGFGGAGGDSGTVDVLNSGNIFTFGNSAVGIFAQAVGGGGGTGGNSSVSSSELSALIENDESVKKTFRTQKYKFALGGFGGSGGHGDQVTVDNSGAITTRGDQATAIYAQSVGGGGGMGGKASTGFTGDISVGGFGGAASDGGKVVVSNTGAITTTGGLADGIFAQSVGGGGGDGGAADFGNARSFRGELVKAVRRKGFKEGLKDLAKKTFIPGFGVGVGGFGGASGDGGEVVVCNGANYDASTGGCAGSVSTATILTTGDASHGIFAQSVGGGGGTGGQAYLTNVGKIGIGGLGGAAGDGGKVTVVNNGDIITQGYGSYGVFAQSVGGGGGLAGDITFGIQGLGQDATKLARDFVNYTSSSQVESVDLDADGTITDEERAETERIFGFNGAGGTEDGSDIDQNGLPISDELAAQFIALYDGTVTDPSAFTSAEPANGQSGDLDPAISALLTGALNDAGGDMKGHILSGLKTAFGNDADLNAMFDGMNGSEVIAFLKAAFTADVASITFKGSTINLLNGITGDGGAVSVETNGNIIVTGGTSDDPEERAGSVGIFAQSVGGGGGIVGNTVAVSEAEIETDLNGDGDTEDTFDVSDGTAFAGTVGGKGKGGTVDVKHTGTIIANSLNGIGIFAQSTGGEGGSNITIAVDGGIIQGGELFDDGTGQAAAILIDGGADNAVTIGANSAIYALSERAIIGGAGNETVTTAGFIQGDIDLGLGANSLTNQQGGLFETRRVINLNGGLFKNEGELELTGFGTIGTTELTGSLTQSETGNLFADFSFGAAASDLLNTSGDVVAGGLVTPNLITLARIAPPETFIRTGGNAAFAPGGMDAVDTLAVDYSVVINGQDVQLAIDGIDFSPSGMTRNQTAAGDFINKILTGDGSEELGTFFAHLGNLHDLDPFAAILQRIHPEAYAAKLAPTLFASQNFSNQMQACPVTGENGAIVYKGECLWARATGRYYDKDRSYDYSNVRETAYAFSSGVQVQVAPTWHIGGAIAYEETRLRVGDLARSEGERFSAGGVVKYDDGSWLLSAALSGGHGFYETDRYVDLTHVVPYADRAQADDDISHANLQLRAARTLRQGDWYIKPTVDLSAIYLYAHEDEERGAGALNLHLKGSEEWVFAVTPSLEIGADYTDPATGIVYRPYLGAGFTWYNKDTLGVQATFEGAPASAGSFEAVSNMDRLVGNITAGLDIVDPNENFDVGFSYDGRFGEETENHTGSVRIGVRF